MEQRMHGYTQRNDQTHPKHIYYCFSVVLALVVAVIYWTIHSTYFGYQPDPVISHQIYANYKHRSLSQYEMDQIIEHGFSHLDLDDFQKAILSQRNHKEDGEHYNNLIEYVGSLGAYGRELINNVKTLKDAHQKVLTQERIFDDCLQKQNEYYQLVRDQNLTIFELNDLLLKKNLEHQRLGKEAVQKQKELEQKLDKKRKEQLEIEEYINALENQEYNKRNKLEIQQRYQNDLLDVERQIDNNNYIISNLDYESSDLRKQIDDLVKERFNAHNDVENHKQQLQLLEMYKQDKLDAQTMTDFAENIFKSIDTKKQKEQIKKKIEFKMELLSDFEKIGQKNSEEGLRLIQEIESLKQQLDKIANQVEEAQVFFDQQDNKFKYGLEYLNEEELKQQISRKEFRIREINNLIEKMKQRIEGNNHKRFELERQNEKLSNRKEEINYFLNNIEEIVNKQIQQLEVYEKNKNELQNQKNNYATELQVRDQEDQQRIKEIEKEINSLKQKVYKLENESKDVQYELKRIVQNCYVEEQTLSTNRNIAMHYFLDFLEYASKQKKNKQSIVSTLNRMF